MVKRSKKQMAYAKSRTKRYTVKTVGSTGVVIARGGTTRQPRKKICYDVSGRYAKRTPCAKVKKSAPKAAPKKRAAPKKQAKPRVSKRSTCAKKAQIARKAVSKLQKCKCQ
jgi:hypothetical protein